MCVNNTRPVPLGKRLRGPQSRRRCSRWAAARRVGVCQPRVPGSLAWLGRPRPGRLSVPWVGGSPRGWAGASRVPAPGLATRLAGWSSAPSARSVRTPQPALSPGSKRLTYSGARPRPGAPPPPPRAAGAAALRVSRFPCYPAGVGAPAAQPGPPVSRPWSPRSCDAEAVAPWELWVAGAAWGSWTSRPFCLKPGPVGRWAHCTAPHAAFGAGNEGWGTLPGPVGTGAGRAAALCPLGPGGGGRASLRPAAVCSRGSWAAGPAGGSAARAGVGLGSLGGEQCGFSARAGVGGTPRGPALCGVVPPVPGTGGRAGGRLREPLWEPGPSGRGAARPGSPRWWEGNGGGGGPERGGGSGGPP